MEEFPHYADLPKYKDIDISYEKLMFIDYDYLVYVYNNLELNRYDKVRLKWLLEEGGENRIPKKHCDFCSTNLVSSICYCEKIYKKTRKVISIKFCIKCISCSSNCPDQHINMKCLGLKFSSVLEFNLQKHKKQFMKELRRCLGVCKRITDDTAFNFFSD